MVNKPANIFSILLVLFLFSCDKAKDVSPIPSISLYQMVLVEASAPDVIPAESKRLEILIDFIDGDGDISFYEQDTVKNIIYTLYKMENDTFKLVELENPYHWTIPFYEPKGTNKVVQGKIKTKFLYEDIAHFDTIKFDCYIFDRAYNKSNIISTPTIIVADL